MNEVLKEAGLLAKLSHPSVVRYYNIWMEKTSSSFDDSSSDDGSGDDISLGGDGSEIVHSGDFVSQGPLDFISSSRRSFHISFDDDSEAPEDGEEKEKEADDESEHEDDSDDDDDDDDDNDNDGDESGSDSNPKDGEDRSQAEPRPFTRVIYISMEYCEKRVRSTPTSSSLFFSLRVFLLGRLAVPMAIIPEAAVSAQEPDRGSSVYGVFAYRITALYTARTQYSFYRRPER